MPQRGGALSSKPSGAFMLTAEPITAESFSPYGTLMAWQSDLAARQINNGTSQRLDWPNALALTAQGGEPRLALFHAQARAFPFSAVELEVHRLGSQTFAPLGVPSNEMAYVVLVARSRPDGSPNLATLRAFACTGAQAVSLSPGTWHHALLALREASFVVVERAAADVDCDETRLAVPVQVRL